MQRFLNSLMILNIYIKSFLSISAFVALINIGFSRTVTVQPAEKYDAVPIELDNKWKNAMLAGESIEFTSDGGKHELAFASRRIEFGDLDGAHLGPSAIIVSYPNMQGGGWVLKGGKLSSLDITQGKVELYGRRNQRYKNSMWNNYIDENESSVHLFLVLRKCGKTTLLREWYLPPRDNGSRLKVTGELSNKISFVSINVMIKGNFNAINEYVSMDAFEQKC